MFALNFYTDTVKQAHDCEEASVWWDARLQLFENISVAMGIKVKKMSARDAHARLRESLRGAWQVQHDHYLASLEEEEVVE
jgi:hypothetical protein